MSPKKKAPGKKRSAPKVVPKRAANAELNVRQRRFAELFDGNITAAARGAGYTGSDQALCITGKRLLKNDNIRKLIKGREQTRTTTMIATREQRQEFWTQMMNDVSRDDKSRLKASELLGRSETDFVEKHEVEIDVAERMMDLFLGAGESSDPSKP